jgi:hypothetical protein
MTNSYYYDEVDAPEAITVRFTGGYRPGEMYEWGVEGSPEVWGDSLDPAKYDPTTWDTDDTDGHPAVWVRPCSYTAAHNVGGIAACPVEYRRRWHDRAVA